MKIIPILQRIGIFICVSILAIVIAIFASIAACEFLPLPRYDARSPKVNIQQTSGRIAEGKRIILSICIHCHYNYDKRALAGRHDGNPEHFGDFSAGNITLDSATGIGKWSSGQLYYFLKTGIKPDGNFVFDMPKYCNLSDEDLFSIISFLKSNDSLTRSTYNLIPKPNFSVLTKWLLRTSLIPPKYEEKGILPPDTDDYLVFGKYLATAKYSCYICHSSDAISINYHEPEKSPGYFIGDSNQVDDQSKRIYAPNLTGDTLKGIGKLTEEQFIKAVRDGVKPDGTCVRDPMFAFSLVTDREAKSIYAYLLTLK